MSFKVAADSSKAPGIYVLTFTKSSDDINAYDPIGGLLVRVSAGPCQPEVSTTSVKIPQGGYYFTLYKFIFIDILLLVFHHLFSWIFLIVFRLWLQL